MTQPTGTRPSWSPAEWLTARQFAIMLAALVAVSYPLVVAGLETFYHRDYGVLAYPTIHHHRESFWRGQIPLWNPLSHCGVPFLAQWGTMVLYPPALFYLLFPLPWSLSVFCLGHLWLGGMGMFLLTSRWTGHRFGAAVAGCAYAFSGLTLSSLMWPNWTAALGLLPWVVYCGELAGRHGGSWLVHACVAGALQLLTGVPEVVILTWLTLVALWLASAWEDPQGSSRYLLHGVMLVGLVSLLSAAQLLPFFDLIAHSQRQTGSSDVRWSMPVWGLANLVVPLFHCFATPQATFAQQDQAFFTSYYPGLFVLMLVLAGFPRLETARQRVTLLLLVVGLVLALGPKGHLYSWLQHMIPGLGLGRFPVKFLTLMTFGAPVLAAYAVASLHPRPDRPNAPRWKTLAGCTGALLVAGAIVLWLGRVYPFRFDRWNVTATNFAVRAIWLLAAVLLLRLTFTAAEARLRLLPGLGILVALWLDLRFHWPSHNPTLAADIFVPRIAKLEPVPELFKARIYIAPWAGEQFLHSTVKDRTQDLIGKRLAMWSNLNLLERIPNLGGAMTLRLHRYEALYQRLQQAEAGSTQRLLDFLAVTHTSATNNPVEWQRRQTALPWATAGQTPRFLKDDSVTLDAITSPDFDPSTTLLLPEAAAPEIHASTRGETVLEVQPFTDQHFQISIRADKPALVSIAQTYHPNWRASVGGAPLPVLRANYAFQAVQVPEGRHVIDLRYVDRGFLVGVVAAFIGLLLCALQVWRRSGTPGSPIPPQAT